MPAAPLVQTFRWHRVMIAVLDGPDAACFTAYVDGKPSGATEVGGSRRECGMGDGCRVMAAAACGDGTPCGTLQRITEKKNIVCDRPLVAPRRVSPQEGEVRLEEES